MYNVIADKSYLNVVIVFVTGLLYIYFPGKLIWIMPDEIRENSIEIFCLHRYDDEETRTIELSGSQQAELIDLFSWVYDQYFGKYGCDNLLVRGNYSHQWGAIRSLWRIVGKAV